MSSLSAIHRERRYGAKWRPVRAGLALGPVEGDGLTSADYHVLTEKLAVVTVSSVWGEE